MEKTISDEKSFRKLVMPSSHMVRGNSNVLSEILVLNVHARPARPLVVEI